MAGRFVSAWVLPFAAVLALSSCATSQGNSAPTQTTMPMMWQTQFNQALADPKLSDFGRQVLSDYRVTTAEEQESFQLFSGCVADAGYTLSGTSSSFSVGFSWDPADENGKEKATSAANQAMVDCEGPDSDSAFVYISSIYTGMSNNPGGLSIEQLIKQCYQAHNVPDGATFSDDEFAQMVDDVDYVPSSPDAALCYWDPTGEFGVTKEQAEQMDAKGFTYKPSVSPS